MTYEGHLNHGLSIPKESGSPKRRMVAWNVYTYALGFVLVIEDPNHYTPEN